MPGYDTLLALLDNDAGHVREAGQRGASSARLAQAQHHGLVPLLHQARVQALASAAPPGATTSTWDTAPDGADAAFVTALREQALAMVMWELAHRAELSRVLDALAKAAVMPLLLKGTPLSFTHYAQPALRPRGDTDLLLAPAQRDAAFAVLEALGYRRAPGIAGRFISYQANFSRRDSHRVEHHLDVHWRINNSQMLARLLTYDELAAAAIAIPALGPHARAPDAVHALLFACMHRAGHANVPYYSDGRKQYGGDRLIWLYDIHLLLGGMGKSGQVEFARLAVDKGLTAVCRDALLATRAAFATEVPAPLLQALGPRGRSEATVRLLKGGALRQLCGDFLALDSWPERAGLAREYLCPDREYMRAKYPDARVRWLPMLHLRRMLGGLRRVATLRS